MALHVQRLKIFHFYYLVRVEIQTTKLYFDPGMLTKYLFKSIIYRQHDSITALTLRTIDSNTL